MMMWEERKERETGRRRNKEREEERKQRREGGRKRERGKRETPNTHALARTTHSDDHNRLLVPRSKQAVSLAPANSLVRV